MKVNATSKDGQSGYMETDELPDIDAEILEKFDEFRKFCQDKNCNMITSFTLPIKGSSFTFDIITDQKYLTPILQGLSWKLQNILDGNVDVFYKQRTTGEWTAINAKG